MAKNKSDEATTNAEATTEQVAGTVATTEGAATTAAVAGSDDRFKKVIDPETGAEVNRKDYILKLFQERKMSRGAIAKHLSEITGKKVAYQIVFATTKGKPGGPDKPVEGTVAAAPATTEQAAS